MFAIFLSNVQDCAGHGQRYIATQSPLHQTVADFWRMVWEYKCPVVVMTTLCKENGIVSI